MTLIACPECKKQVSDTAPMCPHCGLQVPRQPVSAYSGPFRPLIPEQAGHPFRSKAATDSGGSRPGIPEHSGHPWEADPICATQG